MIADKADRKTVIHSFLKSGKPSVKHTGTGVFGGIYMAKQSVTATDAPAALGPYSQAVIANGFVFCSAQAGIDPATGQLVAGGIEAQTERVIRNLKAVLEAAGSDLDKVVKVTVYLASMDDFKAMNGSYAGFFKEDQPARAAIEIGRLPLGALVGMECVAVV